MAVKRESCRRNRRRRRLSLAIVVRLYEPAGKAASRGQRPGLRLRPAAEKPAPGADDDGDHRNGHVVDHTRINGTSRMSSDAREVVRLVEALVREAEQRGTL